MQYISVNYETDLEWEKVNNNNDNNMGRIYLNFKS